MAIGLGGWSDSFCQFRASEFCAIKIRRSSPRRCPSFQKWKLNAQNCSLDFVQAKIASNDMVKIARSHAVLSGSSQPSRQRLIPADDHPRITSSSEVLRRIKTKETNFAHRSGFGSGFSERKLRTNRLRCIFDQIKVKAF